jgi:hypothetical protein
MPVRAAATFSLLWCGAVAAALLPPAVAASPAAPALKGRLVYLTAEGVGTIDFGTPGAPASLVPGSKGAVRCRTNGANSVSFYVPAGDGLIQQMWGLYRKDGYHGRTAPVPPQPDRQDDPYSSPSVSPRGFDAGLTQNLELRGAAVLLCSDFRPFSDRKEERTLFSAAEPDALLTALGLSDRVPPPARREWSLAAPSLTWDGKTALFAANLGWRETAGRFWLVAVDAVTGTPRSVAPPFTGPLPARVWLHPFAPSTAVLVPVSAYRNTGDGAVIVPLNGGGPPVPLVKPGALGPAAAVDSACWSEDGRFVAVAWKRTGDAPVYRLRLYDARTGRTVRNIPGARRPHWGTFGDD